MNSAAKQFAAGTHSGLKRRHNEDCYAQEPDIGLWLVADGVGGHSCGEVASDIVRTVVAERVAAGDSLTEAIQCSHRAVLDAIREREDTADMGSTVVAVKMAGDDYEIAWVGDSRAYLWKGTLEQLTVDHSRVSEMLSNNEISTSEAAAHPLRHVLTQSLGVSETMEPEPGTVTGTLHPGERILLCSDGLSDELPDATIAAILAGNRTPQGSVDALIKAALEAGGSDNVTVLVVAHDREVASNKADLEITRDIGTGGEGQGSRRSGFPFRALALLSLFALLAIWLLA